MNAVYRWFLLFSCLCLTGCTNPPVKLTDLPPSSISLPEAGKKAADTQGKLEASGKSLQTISTDLQGTTNDLHKVIPASASPQAAPYLQNLQSSAVKVGQEAITVSSAASAISDIRAQIAAAEAEASQMRSLYEESRKQSAAQKDNHEKLLAEKDKKIKELEKSRDEALDRALRYLIVLSVVAIGICVAMCFQGNPKAIGGAIAGILMIIIASVVRKYGDVFAVVGGMGILITIGVVVYTILRSRKTEKALEETVYSMEVAKENMPDDTRKQVFGDKATPGLLHTVQSQLTQALVQEKRLLLKPKIKPLL